MGHREKCPLHTGQVKLRLFCLRAWPKKLFSLKGGRTLDLMLHEALRPSDLSMEPTRVVNDVGLIVLMVFMLVETKIKAAGVLGHYLQEIWVVTVVGLRRLLC